MLSRRIEATAAEHPHPPLMVKMGVVRRGCPHASRAAPHVPSPSPSHPSSSTSVVRQRGSLPPSPSSAPGAPPPLEGAGAATTASPTLSRDLENGKKVENCAIFYFNLIPCLLSTAVCRRPPQCVRHHPPVVSAVEIGQVDRRVLGVRVLVVAAVGADVDHRVAALKRKETITG